MKENVLLSFLTCGLIDVGGDDAKLEKLQAASSDLATVLRKAPSRTAAFALVAFDPQAPVDDPVVQESLAALKNRWATYVNTFSGIPIAVVRAMLLEALANAALEDDRIGVAFVTSARNTLPFMELGDEREIWADLLVTIEERVDARAEAEWATPSSITLAAISFSIPELLPPKVKTVGVNRDFMKRAFYAAAGPHYHNPEIGNVATDGNPQSPQNGGPWVTEFGDRMAATVGEVIDAVIGKISVEQQDLNEPLNALTAGVSDYVDTAIKAVSSATAGLQRRTNLLWWKEALFSPILRQSYRDLSAIAAATQMAFDLHRQVPTFSPASVSAFLFEAVISLPSVKDGTNFTIRDLVLEVQDNPDLAMMRSASAELIGVPEGRGPVVALISHPDAPNARALEEFRRLTGVPPEILLTLPQWATWIFRELQAARATIDVVKPAKRARKG